jgi:hypothetical protein
MESFPLNSFGRNIMLNAPPNETCHRASNPASLEVEVIAIFESIDVTPPALEHIRLIGHSAMRAQELFYAVATYTPTPFDLAQLFYRFVLDCAIQAHDDSRP